jgi:signal transduction histidine kinase
MSRSRIKKAEESKTTSSAVEADGGDSFALCRAEFIDRIAHDLKTPLFGTKEILQLILNGGCGKIQSDLEPLIYLLKQTNEDLLTMTQRLVEIYRYEAGTVALNRSQVDLIPMLGQVISELQPMSKAAEITLSCSTAKSTCPLSIDHQAIEQMLSYLLVNCIKHTAAGGHLEIKVDKSANASVLTLTATGLGITQADLENIFLRSRRHSASQSYSPLGGLELHLCRQIIHAHGGTIRSQKTSNKTISIIAEFP